MADQSDDYELGAWFRCPDCGETHEGRLEVKQFLAFGNVSLELDCRACGFSHKARDWRNQNLRRGIRLRRWVREAFLTHPRCGATMHAAAKCANCTARGHVTVEVEREERGPRYDRSYASIARIACDDCDTTYENELTH